MTDTNVFPLVQPGTFSDPLTEVLRDGARALLAQAVETEVASFLAEHTEKHTPDGRQRLVRHGHLPERPIMTGIGPVGVRVPRVRDRLGSADDRIRFTSAILPPYARRSGWRKPDRAPKPPSKPSSRPTAANTRRRSNVYKRTATRCWPTTTFPPNTGSTCEPTRSRARSLPFGIERSDRKVASPTKLRSP